MTRPIAEGAKSGLMKIGDVSLFVETVGHGYPLLLMHGGPSADHWTMLPFRRLADQFTVIFYDHRCNGRSTGAPVESMTWENLTADADAIREKLGFERWAVLGHSFGGHVALEYALRYPDRLSHLFLMDTAGDTRWSQQNAASVIAARGYSAKKVELVRRWFNGEYEPWEWWPIFTRISAAYQHNQSLRALARQLRSGEWHSKVRPEASIFYFGHLAKGWTVMNRLSEIQVPTLVIAGRQDFVFPPDAQLELAAGIPGARLQIIERAGHNPHEEQTDEVMKAVRGFMAENAVVTAGG